MDDDNAARVVPRHFSYAPARDQLVDDEFPCSTTDLVHYEAATRHTDDVQRLEACAVFSLETHVLSRQFADIVELCEQLCQPARATRRDSRCLSAANTLGRRLVLFAAQHRAGLSNELRQCLWMARLRCVQLASQCTPVTSSSMLCACTVPPSRDAEQRAAYGVLLADTAAASGTLDEWAAAYRVGVAALGTDVVRGIANASLVVLWKAVVQLTHRWNELPYTAHLIAYVHLLLRRTAHMTSYVVCFESLNDTNYAQTRATFNHPLFVERRKQPLDESGRLRTVLCVNEQFVEITERTFYALEYSLLCCATHVRWLTPALCASEQRELSATLSPPLDPVAVRRLDQLVASMITRKSVGERKKPSDDDEDGDVAPPTATNYIEYVEKDFQERFYDYMVLPGEWERFEMLRPYDDRRPITCVSRMRKNDFDRYQHAFLDTDKPLEDVWAHLVRTGQRSHPAYALIAERALSYYMDEHFDGISLDVYLVDANDAPPPAHSRDDVLPPCTFFRMPGQQSAAARGTARHTVLAARSGTSTFDSTYAHPLIVRTLGSFVVVNSDGTVVGPRRTHEEQHFAGAFLHWLSVLCSDGRIQGVLPNGKSAHSLLRELRPHGARSTSTADTCKRTLDELTAQRLSAVTLLAEPAVRDAQPTQHAHTGRAARSTVTF